MPVIVVGAEKNFAALRPRLFAGKVSNTTVHEVTAAIAAANPHADLTALQPGTVLTVPDLPKVSVRGDMSLDETSRQALGGILETAGTMLDQLARTARTREAERTSERKQLTKTLESKALDPADRRDKAVAAAIKATEEGLAAEESLAKEQASAVDAARAAWGEELESLKKLLP